MHRNPQTTQAIAGGAQWIRLASAIASEFQGYLTAACGFRDAHGFAYISNGYPGGESTLAQGYLAVCTAGTSCGPINSCADAVRRAIAQQSRV